RANYLEKLLLFHVPIKLDPCFYCFDLLFEFLVACFAFDAECAITALGAIMRESQKVECFRLSFSAFPTVLLRKTSEFEDFRFLLRHLQIELIQSDQKCRIEPLCILFVLEAAH